MFQYENEHIIGGVAHKILNEHNLRSGYILFNVNHDVPHAIGKYVVQVYPQSKILIGKNCIYVDKIRVLDHTSTNDKWLDKDYRESQVGLNIINLKYCVQYFSVEELTDIVKTYPNAIQYVPGDKQTEEMCLNVLTIILCYS